MRNVLLSALLLGIGMIAALPATATSGVFPMVEASFDLANLTGNPFDFTENDIQVTVGTPDGASISVPAFFDGGATWRIRYTPLKTGRYRIKGITRNGSPIANIAVQPTVFNVSGAELPGFIRLDQKRPYRFLFDNGTAYYPIGHNVAWSSGKGEDVTDIFPRMGAVGENWARVWMNHWDNKNLDWTGEEKLSPGQLSLNVARRWDAILQSATKNGIYFQMTLQHHGQYSSTVNPNWGENPWNRKNGGFLDRPEEFFTSEQARRLTRAKYRYIIARYGYSPNILAWELYNEVQFTDAVRNGQMPTVAAWHKEMAAFLRSQDPNHHLVTTSSDNLPGLFDAMDYVQPHAYPPDVASAALAIHPSEWNKPVFLGEIGPNGDLNADTGAALHQILWASVMSESSGTAQYWAWDNIHRRNLYDHFAPVVAFIKAFHLADSDPMRTVRPTVTTPDSQGSLSFAPGAGWSNAKVTSFPILPDGSVQDIGKMPEFFQGKAHADMFPFAEFPLTVERETNVTIQIQESAKAGAHLEVKVDGKTVSERDFPAADSNMRQQASISFTIPSGSHTIRLENSGADWVRISRFTVSPYGPTLRVAAKASDKQAALWVRNLRPDGPSTGTIAVPGMLPGKYKVTWWNTQTGKPLSEGTVEVKRETSLVLRTPPIETDIALFLQKR